MGTEAVWVPAVLAAVGSGIQAKEAHDTAKNMDQEAAQGIRLQGTHQRQADERVAQEVNKLQGSTPEDSQRQATDAFMSQLKRTRAQAHGGDQVGAVSDAFTSGSAGANADIDKYGANRAGVLGRINAPGIQRQAETTSRLRAGTDLGLIGRASAGDQFLSQLRESQIRANPWTMAAGQVIGGAGSGMASSGGYGKKSKPYGGAGYGSGSVPVSGFDPYAGRNA